MTVHVIINYNYYTRLLQEKNQYIHFLKLSRMKSTLKVHNPRVIILLICINDVQEKELSFQVCNIIMKVIDNIQQPSLLAVQSHSDSQL